MKPPLNVQTRINRQYRTVLQQCFALLTPIVLMQEDPLDAPRPAQLTKEGTLILTSMLLSAKRQAEEAAKFFPELKGLDNHASRTYLRLDSLARVVHIIEADRHGYALATVAFCTLESLPADLFLTDEDEKRAEETPS